MDENTFVVKPSARQIGLPSFDDIKRSCVASGFRGNLNRVGRCNYIVVTNGKEAFIGTIVSVERFNVGTIPSRVIIKFKEPKDLESEIIKNIKWSSSNIRYTTL
jgi:hypothetical protein